MKRSVAFSLLALSSYSQAVELYSNGAAVNSSGLSVLSAPATNFGAASTARFALADNFTVSGAGWNVASLDFFGYQTQATSSTFTFTNVTWSIVSGGNVNTGTTVASGTTAVTNAGLMGYRVAASTPTDTQRPIFRLNTDIPDISLSAGNYFVTWSLAGTGTLGPFVPPVQGSLGVGNGLQREIARGAFVALADGSQSYDVPFSVNGTLVAAVPEAGSLAMMLTGGMLVAGLARRRRELV
jgi:hypothetical protein